MPANTGGRRWLAPGVLAAATVMVLMVALLSRLFAPSPITITTSNIRAVTSEPGMEWQPALSPDGSQVAFVSGRGRASAVLVRSAVNVAAGGEVTLARDGRRIQRHPLWSHDGEFVRFASCAGGSCSLREATKLGGSIRSIDMQTNVEHASWSPDGSRVAFIAGPDSIFSYSISNSTTELLAVHGEVSSALHSPTWSPDGRRIAFVSGNQRWLTIFNVLESSIWIVDAVGGEPVRVTGNDFMDVSPVWFDEDHLLFVSNREGPREVYLVEVGPTGPRGELRKVPGVTDPHSISYSIVGRKLAFAKATLRQNIWSYRIGSGPLSITDGHPVTNDNAVIEAHDISRDGRWIVYSSNLRGNMDIYKRLLEGGSPVPITETPVDENLPRWSPDGAEIAFHGIVGAGERVVMVAPADGGTPIQLVSGPGMHIRPKWSRSGLEIAFASNRTGRSEAWITSREVHGGSWGEATQLTDFGCHPTDWAPDGSGVLCSTDEEIVLVSRGGEVLWRYDLLKAGLQSFGRSHVFWEGSTIYLVGSHENGSEGIWAIPTQGGEPSLIVAYDDAEIDGLGYFSVGPENLYITVGEYESDIWVMDVEVGR
jgi:Tol biopolymer transport system component